MPSHSSGPEFLSGGREEGFVDGLSVSELARCCAEETNKFLRQSKTGEQRPIFAILRKNPHAVRTKAIKLMNLPLPRRLGGGIFQV